MSIPRLPLRTVTERDPALDVFTAVEATGTPVPTLYRLLAHAPLLLKAWVDFAWPLRNECRTPRALREILILRVVHLRRVRYEWRAHVPMALAAGVTQRQVDALAGVSPRDDVDNFSAPERAALALATEMLEGATTDATFAAAAALFDHDQLVEVILTIAFYCCVSAVVDALGLDEQGEDLPT